jgi:hypothetical protein
MNQTVQTEPFLKTGLGLYAEARSTLAAFEDVLQKVLVAAFDAFLRSAGPFSFQADATTTNTYFMRSLREKSPWMSVWRPGKLAGATCEFYLGVWWRPPLDGECEYALYACFNDTGRRTEMCMPKRGPDHDRVKAKDHRFIIPYTKADKPDLAGDADLLLRVFAKAFSR